MLFLFFHLFIFCNQNINPRRRKTLPICLSCSWLCVHRQNCSSPENHLQKKSQGHSSWSSSPAPSCKPFSTQHLQPSFSECPFLLRTFPPASNLSSRPNRIWPQPVRPQCLQLPPAYTFPATQTFFLSLPQGLGIFRLLCLELSSSSSSDSGSFSSFGPCQMPLLQGGAFYEHPH